MATGRLSEREILAFEVFKVFIKTGITAPTAAGFAFDSVDIFMDEAEKRRNVPVPGDVTTEDEASKV